VILLDYANTGDIQMVSAGVGLSGGGTAGAISLGLATAGVTAAHLATGSVGATAIGANAVGPAQIQNGAVTGSKLAAGAIASNQLASNAAGSAQLAAASVAGTHIAAGAVGSAQIAAGGIGAGNIADLPRTVTYPSHSLNQSVSFHPDARNEWGLNWPQGGPHFADLTIRRPADCALQGPVKLAVNFQPSIGPAAGASVNFSLKADSHNNGDVETFAATRGPVTVPVAIAGAIYKAEFTLDASNLAKELWRFRISRREGAALDNFPANVFIVSATLTYPSAQ
jgi:hypothetical protein